MRTERERWRRNAHGDKGATFSKGKLMAVGVAVSGCVTTFATKDNMCCEIYERL